MARLVALAALTLLAACSPRSSDEDRQLNEAATALDANDSLPADQLATQAVNGVDQSSDQGNTQ